MSGETVRVAVLSSGRGFPEDGLISVGSGLGDKDLPSFSDDKKSFLSEESVSFAVSSEQVEFPKGGLVPVGRGLRDEGSSSLSGDTVRVAVLSERQGFSEGGGEILSFGQPMEKASAFVDESAAFSVSVEEGEKWIDGKEWIDGKAITFTDGQWANKEQAFLEGSAVTFSIQVAENSFPEGKVVSFINYESALKTVFFAVDSSELSHTTQKALDQNIRWLRNYPEVRVVLEGHCDPQGSEAYNIQLGQSRAEEVKQYLVEQGIAEERLALISYGEANLLSYEDDAKNRRVSFLIDPETQKGQE